MSINLIIMIMLLIQKLMPSQSVDMGTFPHRHTRRAKKTQPHPSVTRAATAFIIPNITTI